MRKIFYGWWITAAVFVSFGITVGVPYYGMPFFYDYLIREFGWTRADITLGFPLGDESVPAADATVCTILFS